MPSTATRLILTWPSQIKAHSSIPNNPKDANERPASDKPPPHHPYLTERIQFNCSTETILHREHLSK